MRHPQTKDLYAAVRIFKKLKFNAADLRYNPDSENADQEMGIAMLIYILENLDKAQDEINAFIGGLCGMTGEEFNELPIEQTIGYIKELKSMPGLSDFFGAVGRLTK